MFPILCKKNPKDRAASYPSFPKVIVGGSEDGATPAPRALLLWGTPLPITCCPPSRTEGWRPFAVKPFPPGPLDSLYYITCWLLSLWGLCLLETHSWGLVPIHPLPSAKPSPGADGTSPRLGSAPHAGVCSPAFTTCGALGQLPRPP